MHTSKANKTIKLKKIFFFHFDHNQILTPPCSILLGSPRSPKFVLTASASRPAIGPMSMVLNAYWSKNTTERAMKFPVQVYCLCVRNFVWRSVRLGNPCLFRLPDCRQRNLIQYVPWVESTIGLIKKCDKLWIYERGGGSRRICRGAKNSNSI